MTPRFHFVSCALLSLATLAACGGGIDWNGGRYRCAIGGTPCPGGQMCVDTGGGDTYCVAQNEVPTRTAWPDGGEATLDAGSNSDGGSPDAGNAIETGFDAGTTSDSGAEIDSGADFDAGEGTDAGSISDAGSETDAGVEVDAGVGTGTDAGWDAGANAHAGADSGVDAGPDSGAVLDAGPDAGSDAGPTLPWLKVVRCAPTCASVANLAAPVAIPFGETVELHTMAGPDAGATRLVFDTRGGGLTGWTELASQQPQKNLAASARDGGASFTLIDFAKRETPFTGASYEMVAGADICDPDGPSTHVTLLEANRVRARLRTVTHPTRVATALSCSSASDHDDTWEVARDYTVYTSGQVFLQTTVTPSAGLFQSMPPARVVVAGRHEPTAEALFKVAGGGALVTVANPNAGCSIAGAMDWIALNAPTASPPHAMALFGGFASATSATCEAQSGSFTSLSLQIGSFPNRVTTANQLLLVSSTALDAQTLAAQHDDLERRARSPQYEEDEGAFTVSGGNFSFSQPVPVGAAVFAPVVRRSGSCSGIVTASPGPVAFDTIPGGCVAQFLAGGGVIAGGRSFSVTFRP